jgi:hypothetical protein
VPSILYNLGITEQEAETMLATSQSTELSLIEMEESSPLIEATIQSFKALNGIDMPPCPYPL